MYAYEVQERQHEPDSMDLLPATFRLAEWHLKTSSVLAARGMFEQAALILEANETLQGEPAIRALRGVANTYRMERFPPLYSSPEQDSFDDGFTAGSASPDPLRRRQPQTVLINNFPRGEKALHGVTTMVLGDPASTVTDKAAALIDLADWYLLFDHRERAEPLYIEALELLTEAGLQTETTRLATPEMLYFPLPPPLPRPSIDKRGALDDGHVTVSYTVTENGAVHDLTTVETAPNDLMEFRVRRSMREARFRPALIEGKLVTSQSQSYTYEYQYYPKVVSDDPLEAAPTTPTSSKREVQNGEEHNVKTSSSESTTDQANGEQDAQRPTTGSASVDLAPHRSATRVDD